MMRGSGAIGAFIIVVLFAAAGIAYFAWSGTLHPIAPPIGGQRDAEGCLTPAGYAFDEEVGACIRAFEMTDDIKKAAGIAVQSVGKGHALTVVSFNSYEEPGAYDIMFERGAERATSTVYIRAWQVVRKPVSN